MTTQWQMTTSIAETRSTIRTDSVIPTFRGVYLDRFLRLVESIDNRRADSQRDAMQKELAWCEALTHPGLDRLKYRAMLMVLRDILGQGWKTQYRQRRIFLTRPDYTHGKHLGLDHGLVKDQIRGSFQDERLSRMTTPSTLRFIKGLECPPSGKRSILDLITSGASFAQSLRKLRANPSVAELLAVVNPYLQLVRAGATDDISGLKLIDIWRYFRYYWAIPYQPTPGRNMFYLVRDAARPTHPVIGIAALGNCVVQLAERDNAIGWTVDSVAQNLQRRQRIITRDLPKTYSIRKITEIEYLESQEAYETRVQQYASTLALAIERALDNELSVINLQSLATERECHSPTEALIRRLLAASNDSENLRRQRLKDSHVHRKSTRGGKHSSSVKEDSKSPLFVRKRARALADILYARMLFQRERLHETPLDSLRRIVQTDAGRKALRIALHSNKKTKIGSSMMDIIVCGAIPPYSEMLGGKLVAMLMASPQVVREYRQLYGGQPGEIASRLAGRDIVRPADLVCLTTSSLYHVGSSQYERIRIPGPHEGEIRFEHLGMTEGFGSTAFTSDTINALREVIIKTEGMRRVNNIFGEGISPKMRLARDGLSLIGVPEDLVLRHNCPRLVYGIKLASNAYEYLRGELSELHYIYPPEDAIDGTSSIIRYWLQRWFAPRSRRVESVRKVAAFARETLLLSREIAVAEEFSENTEPSNVRFG